MRIQHNIPAMNAYRNYTANTKAVSKNLEKLSSGYRINRAGDDAAGLAISEKMRAQVTGLKTAQKNAKDGISLIQTAEGALTEVHSMLNRMVELADQSANGTYSDDTDRENLQKEFTALRSEIDRISKATNFNGISLLDGKQQIGMDVTASDSIAIADAGKTLGTDTLLHTNAKAASKTAFSVDLHDLSYAKAGDTLKMTIGGKELSITTTANMKSSDIATAFKGAFDADATIGGQAFTAALDGSRLTFTQTAVPSSADEVVNATMEVKVEATAAITTSDVTGAGKSAAVGIFAPGTSGGTRAITAGKNSTLGGTIDNAKLQEFANAAKATADGNFTLKKVGGGGADANKLGIYVNDELVATSTTDWAAATGGGAKATYTFNGVGDATITGTFEITPGAAAGTDDLDATAFDTAVTLGTTFTAGAGNKSVDTTGLTSAAIKAAADAAGAGDGEVSLGMNADGTTLELRIGDKVIGTSTTLTGAPAFEDADGNALGTVTITGTLAAADFAAGATVGTGFTYAAAGTAETTGSWNVGTTNNKQGNVETSGQLASTAFSLDADKIKDGHSINIGGTKYTFALGSDSKVDKTGSNVIDLTDLDASAPNLDVVGERLSRAAAANEVFTVGYGADTNKVTVVEKAGQTKADLSTMDNMKAQFSYSEEQKISTGLTLQIGDTSETHNQITVSIGKMDCASLGIDASKINIDGQKGASDSVQVIKNAINQVSTTRGDLGAVQNRLEHTINNLSVMTENIQDAESSIRDVDVAEEMMAYTKNNILVQSAQAMLAQANQLPQGVLQLLG